MKRLYLGIDLGTSAMKIVLIDEEYHVLSQVREEYHLSVKEDGWYEIDQKYWFAGMINGIKKVLENQNVNQLHSIGVTGQMHTLTILDKDGNCIRPAMMWNDLRTKELIPQMKEKIAQFQDGEYLSRTISTGSPAANLYWLKKYEPENYKKIKKFLIGPDYLVYCLTGTYSTDYCEASTSCLYEIKNRKWSEEMRKLLGLSEDVYPQIFGSAEITGTVKKNIMELTGIPEGVKVLAGTGDNSAMALSTGCLVMGYPLISLGTSGVLVIPDEQERSSEYGKRILFSFDNTKYYGLVQGTVQSNGSTLSWWTKKILGKEDFSYIDQIVDLKKERSNMTIFYPHMTGEKTIYADPLLRGAFIGMSLENDPIDLTYSLLEGMCFGIKELAEKMNLQLTDQKSIKVVGGGANSRVWMQIMANVLNCPIERMGGMIGAAFGVALLAAFCESCHGDYSGMAGNTITVEERFEPDKEMVTLCEKKYMIYKRIYSGMKYIMEDEKILA